MLKKYMCQHGSVTLAQHSWNGQNYGNVCPNLTYLWRHSALQWSVAPFD